MEQHNYESGPRRPLALRLRQLRQQNPEGVISQEALALLAGISVRRLRRLEDARLLPPDVEAMHALSLALKTPIEELISTELREDHASFIEDRRTQLSRRDA